VQTWARDELRDLSKGQLELECPDTLLDCLSGYKDSGCSGLQLCS